MVQVVGMPTRVLTETELAALRQFSKLGISVEEFRRQMTDFVRVGSFTPGDRDVHVAPMIGVTVVVSRDDVRWVIQRYLRGKMSGEELSHWAGLLLAIPAYSLPDGIDGDAVLELLTDLAVPLKGESLDRNRLKQRLASL